MVACLNGVQEAMSSNLITQTISEWTLLHSDFSLVSLDVEIPPQSYWGKIKTLVYENKTSYDLRKIRHTRRHSSFKGKISHTQKNQSYEAAFLL